MTFCVRTQKAIVRWIISCKALFVGTGWRVGRVFLGAWMFMLWCALSLYLSLSHARTHTLLSVGIPGLGGMDGDELGVASCS